MSLNRKPTPGELTHAQQRIAAITKIPLGRIKQLVKDGMTYAEIVTSLISELVKGNRGDK